MLDIIDSSENLSYEFTRQSRIMSYAPADKKIGGHVGVPIECSMEDIGEDYFKAVKALVDKIRAGAHNISDTTISGSFEWYVEIGDKNTLTKDLTPIFQSQQFQVIPADILILHKTLIDAMRAAEGRPADPPPSLTF